MLDCFRKTVKNEGFTRLYRGISAPILMEAPKRATKFAANDEWGKFYRKAFGAAQMTQSLSVLTGATAGATESFVVVPFELVKIRLQDKASAGKYKGMVDCVVKTVRSEGPLAMYQGLESTMWRHILWNAGYFGCIFQVRQLMPKAETKSGQTFNDLISGAIGGTVGTILNTPTDVIKSRIQNTPRQPGVTPKYNWTWPSVATVLREEGISALYKGFLPKVRRPRLVSCLCGGDEIRLMAVTRFCVWVPAAVYFSSSIPLSLTSFARCTFRLRRPLSAEAAVGPMDALFVIGASRLDVLALVRSASEATGQKALRIDCLGMMEHVQDSGSLAMQKCDWGSKNECICNVLAAPHACCS